MSQTAQHLYGASNARARTVVEYEPEPAPAVRGLMADIAARLIGRRGGTYGPGPGTPETSFSGYAVPAPSSMVSQSQTGLGGGGRAYPDRSNNTLSSAVSGGPSTSVAMQMFAERMRRQGVRL